MRSKNEVDGFIRTQLTLASMHTHNGIRRRSLGKRLLLGERDVGDVVLRWLLLRTSRVAGFALGRRGGGLLGLDGAFGLLSLKAEGAIDE